VRVAAAHHPLFGQSVAVVRRKRHAGEPHLVVEGPGGGRQLLPARCAEPAGMVPPAAAPPLTFTPGSLRALVGLAATLRGAPFPAPEAGHAPRPETAAPALAAMEHLPARDAPAPGPALDRPAAAPAPGRAGAGARARGAVP